MLNATRQTGRVLLVGRSDAFMSGAHQSLVISALPLSVAGAAIWLGATAKPAS